MTEPNYVLIGSIGESPEGEALVPLINTESKALLIDRDGAKLLDHFTESRRRSEALKWLHSMGEDANSLTQLVRHGMLAEVTPGSAEHILSQVSSYVLTAHVSPSDFRTERIVFYTHALDGHEVPISAVTGSLLWANPERWTIGEWFADIESRASRRTAEIVARTIVNCLPGVLADRAASLRHVKAPG